MIKQERITDMTDVIVLIIIVMILTVSICYIRKEKKRGVKCIGCPSGGACSKRQQEGEVCTCNKEV